MIQSVSNEGSGFHEALGSYLADVVQPAFTDCPEAEPAYLGDVTRALELYLRETCPEGYVESNHLTMLTSRVLVSLGREDSARRLMLSGTGLFRSRTWAFTGDRPVWTLDLKRLMELQGDRLEMMLFRTLDAILATLAGGWSAGQAGSCVLGLKHVAAAASVLLGRSPESRETGRLVREIQKHCEQRWMMAGLARGWMEPGRVMVMDI